MHQGINYTYDTSASLTRNLQQVNGNGSDTTEPLTGTEEDFIVIYNGSDTAEPPTSIHEDDVDHFMASQAEIQRKRRTTVRAACKKYRSHHYSRHNKYGVATPARFIVNKEYKLIYCSVAKVASTNWRLVFEQLAGTVTPGMEVTQKQINSKLKKDLKYMSNFRPKTAARLVDESLTFMFARHPFSRVLSAYRNKLDPNTTFPRAMFWQRSVGKDIIDKYRPGAWDEHRDFKSNYDLSFADFVRYLGDKTNAFHRFYKNIHWAELSAQCSPCGIEYDVIGKLETMDDDVRYILRSANLDGQVQFGSSESSSPTYSYKNNSIEKYLETVPAEYIRNLYKRYKLDFDIFGYELPEIALRKMKEANIHV